MFEQLRRHAESAHSLPGFFFRDDDADDDIPRLRTLLALFGTRQIPLNLAVIPGTMTAAGANLLREASREAWVELHQHGWRHINHEPIGRKCEFGPSRGYDQQRADIDSGRRRLLELLGPCCANIFTPPWNRCTAETTRALADLGFQAISQDRATGAPGLREIPVAVDIFTWKPVPCLKPVEAIEAEIAARIARCEPAGILLHHKVMDDAAFALVAALMDALRPFAPFHSLEAACAICN